MPTLNGRNYTGVSGLNIKSSNGCIRFEVPDITPTTTSGETLLYRSGTNLVWDSGSTVVTLASATGVATTWDQVYANDKTLAVDGTSFTIALSHATNNGLTVTGAGGSAGNCIQITNSGTGSDIAGTSATWTISKAGAAVFTAITGCDSFTAAANLALNATGAGTIILAGVSTGAITLTTATTCSASLTIGTTLTVGTGATFSDGLVDIIDNSNAASALRITNDTQTTYGNASDAGLVVIRSESLSTGALLHLSADETAFGAGGYYLRCWKQDGGAAAFSVQGNGVTTIGGAGAANAFVITAGDISIGDGSITLTDADDAASLSITNNTAATATLVAIAGSGAFTGSTTTSFVTITPSGLQTGTAVYLPLAAVTSGIGLHISAANTQTSGYLVNVTSLGTLVTTGGLLTLVADAATTAGAGGSGRGVVALSVDALTTGIGINATCTSAAITSGLVAQFDHTTAAATGDKTGQVVNIVASRTVTAAAGRSDDYDAVSIVRTSVMNNAGGTLAAAGSVLYVKNTSTQTAGGLTDTTNGIELIMEGTAGEIQGVGLYISHANTTVATGYAIDVAASHTTRTAIRLTANGLTTGYGMSLEHGTAVIASGGSILNIASTAIDTASTTGCLLNLSSNASTSGTQVLGTFSALTDGIGVSLVTAAITSGTMMLLTCNNNTMTTGIGLSIASTGTGLTSGSLFRVSSATTGAVATNGIVSIRATGNYTSTSNAALFDVSASATTAGTVANISGAALTTGVALYVAGAGAYTGTGFVNIAPSGLTTGVGVLLTTAAVTTGIALSVIGGATLTTGNIAKFYDNSADVSSRNLVWIHNDNAAAVGAFPLYITQDAVQGTGSKFKKILGLANATIWVSIDGTTANGNLSGTAGDICLNGGSNKPEYCTGTTNWTALV